MIAIDLETTGFGYKSGDKIISFGYIDSNMELFKEIFINTHKKISHGAMAAHGISSKKLKHLSGGRNFKDNSLEIFKIMEDQIVLEYSKSDFDSKFLREEFKNAGLGMPKCEFINVYKLVKKNGKKTLKDAYLHALRESDEQPIQFDNRFEEITGTSANAHGALYDAFMCMVCYAYYGNKG